MNDFKLCYYLSDFDKVYFIKFSNKFNELNLLLYKFNYTISIKSNVRLQIEMYSYSLYIIISRWYSKVKDHHYLSK